MKCQNCGCELPNTAKFCSSCGFKISFAESDAKIVQETVISEESKSQQESTGREVILTYQGQDTKFPTVPPLNPLQQITPVKTKKNNYIIAIISPIIIIAILVIIISIASKNERVNFKNKYSYLSNESWCTIDSSGKWMNIDTNPYNIDKDDLLISDKKVMLEATDKIQEINLDLGFTDALYKKMSSTNALQGTQTEENEKYKVTWSYHPDNGLEVMYEYNKN